MSPRGPSRSAGSREEKPTYVTMLSTATSRLVMVTRLRCTGRVMSPIRMGSSPIMSSWRRFASLQIT
uniref:Uncharacterized protein n=1 Tax=Arundo donax TaxID=35708 RepID=A0A0A9H8J8_ARUDO